MKKLYMSFLGLALACLPLVSLAQQGQQVYLQTIARSVPPGGGQAWVSFVRDIIKPMYEAEIDNGRLTGFYVWAARYKAEDAPYSFVIAVTSNNLANLDSVFEGGTDGAARRVHGMSPEQFSQRASQAPSTVVKRELWSQSSLSLLSPTGVPPRWSNLSFYRNLPAGNATRNLLLRDFMATWQQGRIDRGISAGWGYYGRRAPFDGPDSYNVVEVAYYDDFDQVLGANIGQQIWDSVRTDNSSLDDNRRRLEETRTLIKREIWELVDFAIAD